MHISASGAVGAFGALCRWWIWYWCTVQHGANGAALRCTVQHCAAHRSESCRLQETPQSWLWLQFTAALLRTITTFAILLNVYNVYKDVYNVYKDVYMVYKSVYNSVYKDVYKDVCKDVCKDVYKKLCMQSWLWLQFTAYLQTIAKLAQHCSLECKENIKEIQIQIQILCRADFDGIYLYSTIIHPTNHHKLWFIMIEVRALITAFVYLL